MALSNSTVSKPELMEKCCAVTQEICIPVGANQTIDYSCRFHSNAFIVEL